MFEYAINVLVQGVSGLLAASTVLAQAKNPLSPADPKNLKSLSKVLFGLHVMGKDIGLDSSLLEQIATLNKLISRENCKTPTIRIELRLDIIVQGILGNLDSKKFMFVPTDQAFYWENPTIFGDDFVTEFPEAARVEAVEAGNCFAAGRWTACVFHCVRVAEYGLRKLAKRLRVTLSDKGKRCPLEYGDWTKVIGAIRKKIDDTRKLPLGPKKADSLRRYSDLADRCEYMKDIWRNELSHTRRTYDRNESLGIINRVHGFIQCIPKTQKAAPGIS